MKLSIRNLHKSFDDKVVLKGVNLELDNIHSLVIIGPSGGGKSTLLRIIAGLELPDKGEIYINDRKINFGDEKDLNNYKKSVAMVFQAYNLFPHLTAHTNITLPLEKVHHITKKKASKTADKLLAKFKLSEHSHKKPLQLSGGQQQRVALARATAINPTMLLLDEPTSSLDPELTAEVLDMILELKEEKKDLILVTHEMGFAKNVSQYALFVDEGIILEQGESKELFLNPKSNNLIKFLEKVQPWN